LNPLNTFTSRRRKQTDAAKIYGAIVAQARLPIFYQGLGVPDTLEGRFLVLSLHLFAILHRLKLEGQSGLGLAQALSDRFTADMETVLREIGVGDLSVPKKMRRLTHVSASLLQACEGAVANGRGAITQILAGVLPAGQKLDEAAKAELAHYLIEVVECLETQNLAELAAGDTRFPRPIFRMELEQEQA
jgi:cytochrome b pre-mRNA-processing protein 3